MNVKEFYQVFEVYGCYGGTDGTEHLIGEFESKAEAQVFVAKLEDESAYDYIRIDKA